MSSQPEWVAAQMAERQPPAGAPGLSMRWENLLFLHWAWSAADIQNTLPSGLRVDTLDGRAWLGMVPFFMRRVHPKGLPCVPWVSDFLELNVRTYVKDERGVPGVWFYSLSCNQPMAVWLARRFFHLNYVHAKMNAHRDGAGVHYRCQRRDFAAAQFHYRSSGPFLEPERGSLGFFLSERYVLYSADARGRLFAGKVHHAPYATAAAEVAEWSFLPGVADGFGPVVSPPDHVMAAEDLQVGAWPLVRLGG